MWRMKEARCTGMERHGRAICLKAEEVISSVQSEARQENWNSDAFTLPVVSGMSTASVSNPCCSTTQLLCMSAKAL